MHPNAAHQALLVRMTAAANSIEWLPGAEAEMPSTAALGAFQEHLRYTFKNSALLRLALVHRSASATNNTVLAFLGDAVLGLLVAEQMGGLVGGAAAWDVGLLTDLRSKRVRRASLAELGSELQLDTVLVLGNSLTKQGEAQAQRRRALRVAKTMPFDVPTPLERPQVQSPRASTCWPRRSRRWLRQYTSMQQDQSCRR